MSCQKHCLDCAADAQGYYNLAHYLQVNGGDVSALVPVDDKTPVRHYPYPAPFEAPRALESGSNESGVRVTPMGSTITSVGESSAAQEDRFYTYDKMDWCMFGLKAVATLSGLGIVAYVVVKIITMFMALGAWLGVHGAAIVGTLSGIALLVVLVLVAAMLSGGGKGGGTWQGSGTWSR